MSKICCLYLIFLLVLFRFSFAQHSQPENKLVLEYLKVIQDSFSIDSTLVPSCEDNVGHTFNNSIAAMAFILKNERERAGRILDFYSNATIKNNPDPTLQNFYYNGEARGFFQSVKLPQDSLDKTAYHTFDFQNDRWIGDMAWLLLAFKYYGKKYNDDRYSEIINSIKELLVSFYKEDEVGGYIQHGWRKNDYELHEPHGHHEGNIDCYAALQACGKYKIANKIRLWLENQLGNSKTLPLDLYTWRALAFGKDAEYFLEIPENRNNNFKKTVIFNGKEVTGFFSFPNAEAKNVWTDGLGHIACAYYAVGNLKSGNYYTNQMDNLLIKRQIENTETYSLPYAANTSSGYDWVDTTKGFSSCCAWYIFAKNKFNPMLLTTNN